MRKSSQNIIKLLKFIRNNRVILNSPRFKILHKLSLDIINSDESFFNLFFEVYYLFDSEKSDLFCEDDMKNFFKFESGKHFLLTTNIGVKFLSNEIKKYLAEYDIPHIDGFIGYKNLFKKALKYFYIYSGNIDNDDITDYDDYNDYNDNYYDYSDSDDIYRRRHWGWRVL